MYLGINLYKYFCLYRSCISIIRMCFSLRLKILYSRVFFVFLLYSCYRYCCLFYNRSFFLVIYYYSFLMLN